jgi:hypothetical protein
MDGWGPFGDVKYNTGSGTSQGRRTSRVRHCTEKGRRKNCIRRLKVRAIVKEAALVGPQGAFDFENVKVRQIRFRKRTLKHH